ncbi:MAG: deoxyribose-phosphate aldolase [Halanaerobiales bacterium]|nr:deoxyribose-phosphate aldolase [Halanaerobiales bacterium]
MSLTNKQINKTSKSIFKKYKKSENNKEKDNIEYSKNNDKEELEQEHNSFDSELTQDNYPIKLSDNPEEISSLIDHTILGSDTTKEEVKNICTEALEYNFASVCVNSYYVPTVYDELKNSDNVKICSVISFPLGATSTKIKIAEAKDAVEKGSQEIDMVMNIGALKAGEVNIVKNDIEQVVKAVKNKALVKVIIECCLLTDREKVKACSLAKIAGADFVKTSTGFSDGGATVEDIKLMRETVGPDMGVKASGGIRDYQTAREMIAAGANRIGASSSVQIIKGESTNKDY